MFGHRSRFPWGTLIVLGCITWLLIAVWPGLRHIVQGGWAHVAAWAGAILAVTGTLLVVGSLAFWIFLGIVVIGISCISSDDWLEDHEFLPLVVFLASGAIMWLCGGINIFKLAWNNLTVAATCLVVYIAAGIVYSRPKFQKYGRLIGEWYENDFKDKQWRFYLKNNIPEGSPIPQRDSYDWHVLVTEHKARFDQEVSLSSNKGRILTWVYTWAFNLLSKFIKNPLRLLSKAVWSAVRRFYASVEESLKAEFGNFGKNVKVEAVPETPTVPSVSNEAPTRHGLHVDF